MSRKQCLGIATVVLAVAFGGNALAATLPTGVQSGPSPESGSALVTLAIPTVVGVNVAHNFVLDFTSGTKCWGTTGNGAFPQAASGTTTYTFAVTATTVNSATTNVACPAAGAQPDLATVQVFSTASVAGKLQVSISDGAAGAQATAFTALISDIFSANRLKLVTSDACGAGSTVTSPHSLSVAASSYVTAIPATGWANCRQTLQLALDSTTTVAAGTASGTLAFTMSSP